MGLWPISMGPGQANGNLGQRMSLGNPGKRMGLGNLGKPMALGKPFPQHGMRIRCSSQEGICSLSLVWRDRQAETPLVRSIVIFLLTLEQFWY